MTIAKHKTLLAVGFLLGFLLVAGIRAMPSGPAPVAPAAAGLLIDLGNEVCPVMGGRVNRKDYIEWNHLRIGICCPGCDLEFLEGPEDALETLGVDWRAALGAVESYLEAAPEHRGHKLAELRKTWTVVREPEGADR